MITDIVEGSPAQKAGVSYGDILVFADGKQINDTKSFVDVVSKSTNEINYVIDRDGEIITFSFSSEEGKIGVGLTNLISSEFYGGLRLFDGLVPSEVSIKEEVHNWYYAPIRALEEMYVASEVTLDGFSHFMSSLFTKGEVPDGISGTVGMVQMTHALVDEGIIDLMRFAAVLSLTLAILNILPIPALDGGRLMFLLYEGFRGRRVNQSAEGVVHFVGFLFLIFLIVVVTYNDIIKIING